MAQFDSRRLDPSTTLTLPKNPAAAAPQIGKTASRNDLSKVSLPSYKAAAKAELSGAKSSGLFSSIRNMAAKAAGSVKDFFRSDGNFVHCSDTLVKGLKDVVSSAKKLEPFGVLRGAITSFGGAAGTLASIPAACLSGLGGKLLSWGAELAGRDSKIFKAVRTVVGIAGIGGMMLGGVVGTYAGIVADIGAAAGDMVGDIPKAVPYIKRAFNRVRGLLSSWI